MDNNKNKYSIALLITSVALILLGLYMAFIYAPKVPDFGWAAPKAQKIFYFHVASAWVSYLAFGIVFVCSIIFLKTNNKKWDIIALSSAEIGVLFCTLAIVTGPIWAKAEWGEYWRWEDLKLFMTLVLWLIYMAYLALRSGVSSSEQSGRLASVFGILGFVCVPLSFAANRIWAQFHPTVIAAEEQGGSLQAPMLQALIVAVFAFTFFYFYLLLKRVELEHMNEKIEELKEIIGDDDYE
jgi:heme exporter protein C